MSGPQGLLPEERQVFPLLACACLASPHEDEVGCVCLREERYLRHVIAGKQSLSQPQRDWCRDEIARVEGYTAADAEGTDEDVARTVLAAWTDYCRDKGML